MYLHVQCIRDFFGNALYKSTFYLLYLLTIMILCDWLQDLSHNLTPTIRIHYNWSSNVWERRKPCQLQRWSDRLVPSLASCHASSGREVDRSLAGSTVARRSDACGTYSTDDIAQAHTNAHYVKWYGVTARVLYSQVFIHSFIWVRSIKRRHHSPECAILSHVNCFIQGEVQWFQVLLGSLHPRSTGASRWSPPVLQGGSR